METWKPVLGFEGLYEVSDIGNVRRIARGKTVDATKIVYAKEMFAAGATLKVVADYLNTSIATAWNIKAGNTWRGNASFRPCKTSLLKGYPQIALCKNGKYVRRPVHRLVWEAFNGPIAGRLEVNHKNLDRADNRLENLELMTHQQNVKHAFDIYRQDPNSRQPAGRPGSYRGKYFKHT